MRRETLHCHRKEREESYEAFSKQRLSQNHAKADASMAEFKNNWNKHEEELSLTTRQTQQKKKALLEEELKKCRGDVRNTIAKINERFRNQFDSTASTIAARERDLVAQLEAEAAHHQRLFESELASTRERLNQETVVDAELALRARTRVQLPDLSATLAALQERLASSLEKSTFALHTLLAEKSMPTESQKLISEREEVVSQLHAHISAQRTALENDWARLGSSYTELQELASALSRVSVDGRAVVAAGAQKVDVVRCQWEKEHREQLSDFTKSEPFTAEEIRAGIVFELCCALRGLQDKLHMLANTRNTHQQRLVSVQDAMLQQQSNAARINASILSKYEEIAKLVAAVESKQLQATQEAKALQQERAALEAQQGAFLSDAAQLKQKSTALQMASATVAEAYKENRDRMKLSEAVRSHITSGRHASRPDARARIDFGSLIDARRALHRSWMDADRAAPLRQDTTNAAATDFSALVQLSSDGASSHTNPPSRRSDANEGTTSHSITTPSPDSEEQVAKIAQPPC